jgi:hypothetical protein
MLLKHVVVAKHVVVGAEAAAYLGALPAKDSIFVTQPFRPENCPKSNPTKILELHSCEGIDAIVQ